MDNKIKFIEYALLGGFDDHAPEGLTMRQRVDRMAGAFYPTLLNKKAWQAVGGYLEWGKGNNRQSGFVVTNSTRTDVQVEIEWEIESWKAKMQMLMSAIITDNSIEDYLGMILQSPTTIMP